MMMMMNDRASLEEVEFRSIASDVSHGSDQFTPVVRSNEYS